MGSPSDEIVNMTQKQDSTDLHSAVDQSKHRCLSAIDINLASAHSDNSFRDSQRLSNLLNGPCLYRHRLDVHLEGLTKYLTEPVSIALTLRPLVTKL
jgi:hypothetical protein